MKKNRLVVFFIILSALIKVNVLLCTWCNTMPEIRTSKALVQLFPKNKSEIIRLEHTCLNQTKLAIKKIYAIPKNKKTFENTCSALNFAIARFNVNYMILSLLEQLSVQKEMQIAARSSLERLQDFTTTNFFADQNIYRAFKSYNNKKQKEKLTPEEKYTLTKYTQAFKLNGALLTHEQQKNLKNIKKKLEQLKLQFNANIAHSKPKIKLSSEELAGIPTHFFNTKKPINITESNYYYILENCRNENTRKKVWRAFINRAYPVNMQLLSDIRNLSQQYAQLLGFRNFAELDLISQMAHDTQTVEQFLHELTDIAHMQTNKTIKRLCGRNLKREPWNVRFYINQAKFLHLNQAQLRHYFPLDHVLNAFFNLTEQFFGIRIKKISVSPLWDSSVKVFAISKSKAILGYLLLDLFNRKDKYKHSRMLTIIPSFDKHPGVCVIITNFTSNYITHGELVRLLHEFGHAFHVFLSKTKLPLNAGTQVKRDFAEMPAQIFEELAWQPEILKQLSSERKTKTTLPDAFIQKIIHAHDFSLSLLLEKNIFKSYFSLDVYKTNANLYQLTKKLFEKTITFAHFDPQLHFYTSFDHIVNYGAKYYSYLWGRVFAIDIFETIKQAQFSPEIWKDYADKILAFGGSAEPEELLFNFLGRRPSLKPMTKKLSHTSLV